MHRALYPGTFDPIHLGHIDIASRSAMIFDELVVAIYERPSKNLLFSTEERVALAQEALEDLANVRVVSYEGLTVEFARQVDAQVIVRGLRVISDCEWEYQVALTNRQLRNMLFSARGSSRKSLCWAEISPQWPRRM